MLSDVRKVAEAGMLAAGAANAARNTTGTSLTRIIVDPGASRSLMAEVKRLMMPTCPEASIIIDELGDPCPTEASCDLLLVISGGRDVEAVERAAISASAAGVPVIIVAQSALDAPDGSTPMASKGSVSLVLAGVPGELEGGLASCITDTCPGAVRLSHGYPFLRRAASRSVMSACASKNATADVMPFFRGSGMNAMSSNQSKMAVEIANAYGANSPEAYAIGVAIVMAAGFGWRSLARALEKYLGLRGRLVRAAIGYGGTMASGMAVRAANELLARRGRS